MLAAQPQAPLDVVQSSWRYAAISDPSIPDWGQDIFQHYQFINGGVWWAVLFPSLAIATLIIGINLVADAIAQTFER